MKKFDIFKKDAGKVLFQKIVFIETQDFKLKFTLKVVLLYQ